MYLYFIRHGVAIDRRPDFSDSDRYLTKSGRHKLRTHYPYLLNEFSDNSCVVWSSPFVRAVQTAEILSYCCRLNTIEIRDFIVFGSVRDLILSIGHLLLYEPDLNSLVVVGHEPHLGSWTEILTGERLYYKKGAVTKIRINPADVRNNKPFENKIPFDAEFIWHKSVKELINLQNGG